VYEETTAEEEFSGAAHQDVAGVDSTETAEEETTEDENVDETTEETN